MDKIYVYIIAFDLKGTTTKLNVKKQAIYLNPEMSFLRTKYFLAKLTRKYPHCKYRKVPDSLGEQPLAVHTHSSQL